MSLYKFIQIIHIIHSLFQLHLYQTHPFYFFLSLVGPPNTKHFCSYNLVSAIQTRTSLFYATGYLCKGLSLIESIFINKYCFKKSYLGSLDFCLLFFHRRKRKGLSVHGRTKKSMLLFFPAN